MYYEHQINNQPLEKNKNKNDKTKQKTVIKQLY